MGKSVLIAVGAAGALGVLTTAWAAISNALADAQQITPVTCTEARAFNLCAEGNADVSGPVCAEARECVASAGAFAGAAGRSSESGTASCDPLSCSAPVCDAGACDPLTCDPIERPMSAVAKAAVREGALRVPPEAAQADGREGERTRGAEGCCAH